MPISFFSIDFRLLFELFLTLTITVVLNTLLRSLIKNPKRIDSKRGKTYVAIVRSIISIALFAIATHIIFILIGVNVFPLLASAGIIGIALGIGARPFIEDVIAGLFLLTQATISIGDYVNIGSGIEGTIEDIGFRTITIRSPNGAVNIISNGQIKQVTNYSRRESILYVDLPIRGDQDVDKVNKILQNILEKMINDNDSAIKVSAHSKVWGIQNIQVPNCLVIRIQIVTIPSLREEVDKMYRYKVVKEFAKQNILFA